MLRAAELFGGNFVYISRRAARPLKRRKRYEKKVICLFSCTDHAPEPDCLRSRQQNCGFQRQQPPCGYLLRDRGEGDFDADTNSYDDEGRDSGGSVLENQKIIYTGDINLETTEFDETVKALAALAEVKGGYLESSTVGGGSRGYRWADYTVRVPSAQFQGFLDQAGELAHVTWRNTNLENITETYYDTAGRLKTQQIKLERLQKLLSQAENMEDIITIESAISETEWNIEDLSGTLRHYDALVDFATVNVHVSEVYKYSDTEELPENFGDRLSSAMSRGWHSFVNGMEDFAVALAYSWMWLILWVVIIVTAVVILRKIRRRSGMKKPLFKKKNDVKPDDKSGDT